MSQNSVQPLAVITPKLI